MLPCEGKTPFPDTGLLAGKTVAPHDCNRQLLNPFFSHRSSPLRHRPKGLLGFAPGRKLSRALQILHVPHCINATLRTGFDHGLRSMVMPLFPCKVSWSVTISPNTRVPEPEPPVR